MSEKIYCQFSERWNVECTKKCKYYKTCTRNPHKQEIKTANKLASAYLENNHTPVILLNKEELKEMLLEERRNTICELETRVEAEVKDIVDKSQGRRNGKTVATMMLHILEAEKIILEDMRKAADD